MAAEYSAPDAFGPKSTKRLRRPKVPRAPPPLRTRVYESCPTLGVSQRCRMDGTCRDDKKQIHAYKSASLIIIIVGPSSVLLHLAHRSVYIIFIDFHERTQVLVRTFNAISFTSNKNHFFREFVPF